MPWHTVALPTNRAAAGPAPPSTVERPRPIRTPLIGLAGPVAIVALWAWMFPALRRVDEFIPNVTIDTPEVEASVAEKDVE